MKKTNQPNITLSPLQADDREQFILDNQWAFKYGAQQEMTEQREQSQTCLGFAESRRNSSEAQFGLRDTRTEEGEEVISRTTISTSTAAASTSWSSGTNISMVPPFQKKKPAIGARMMRCLCSGR